MTKWMPPGATQKVDDAPEDDVDRQEKEWGCSFSTCHIWSDSRIPTLFYLPPVERNRSIRAGVGEVLISEAAHTEAFTLLNFVSL